MFSGSGVTFPGALEPGHSVILLPSTVVGGIAVMIGSLTGGCQMASTNCPGCDHWDNLHAGGWCYTCGLCGWSRLDLPQFQGWWNWRKGAPPGVSMLAVPNEITEMDPAEAVAEAERLMGLR